MSPRALTAALSSNESARRRAGPAVATDRWATRTEVGAMLERFQEMTGIYRLGFNKDSFLGLVIPIGFVLLVGGLGVALVLFL